MAMNVRHPVGFVICDMHDGYSFERLKEADPRSEFQIVRSVRIGTENGSKAIEEIVRGHRDDPVDAYWYYVNKLLVVVDYTPEGEMVAAYSYDARNLVFLVIDVAE